MKRWFRGEEGVGLVDSLAAVAILGVALVSVVVALSVGMITVRQGEQEMVAQSLVQSQLEYVKGYPYSPGATTYPLIDTPEGYSLSVEVSSIPDTDTDIQKITVTVFHDGEAILEVEDFKVNR